MDLKTLPEWDINANDLFEEAVEDNIERPPLTGKAYYVPTGLYNQPWAEVHDAYGEASLTPHYIEALASDDDGDRQFAAYGLYAATTHQGSVYEASGMAIPFLVDMIVNAEKEHPEILASHFLSRIAVGEEHFILSPDDLGIARTRQYHYEILKYADILKAFYMDTQCEIIERLLSFYKGVLPDYINLIHDNNLRQGSALIAQGFIAAERKLKEHVVAVRKLMYESTSLFVRATAAICLVYSGEADSDVIQLIEHLLDMLADDDEFDYTPWAWGGIRGMLCEAWLYVADTETLLSRPDEVPIPVPTMVTQEETEALRKIRIHPLATPFPKLVKAIGHEFNSGRLTPYLPEELNPMQIRILNECLQRIPTSLYDSRLDKYCLPDNEVALKRLLGKSNELLSQKLPVDYDELNGNPLWYIIESWLEYDTPQNRQKVVRAVASVDSWTVAHEVFTEKRCTLSFHSHVGDGIKEIKIAKLISMFADAMYDKADMVEDFLERQLITDTSTGEIKHLELTGIALLALARQGRLAPAYFSLIKGYHNFIEYTRYTLPVLSELLSYTTPEHQQEIAGEVELYTVSENNIFLEQYGWILLKGCQGKWVVDKVRDAAATWQKINAGKSRKITGSPFPYTDAVEILKNQDMVEQQLLYNLLRY